MKTILSILFLTAFGCYESQAQTATSSGKNAQTQVVTESVQTVTPTEATVVSGEKNAEVKKVPLENNQTVVPETKGTTSSARKPD
jgi:hypothetical protein